MSFFHKIYRALSSFGFAAILLLFLLLLTWLGTLEQVNSGLYDVQKKYFESVWLFHDFGPVAIPLPGVYLLLALLLLNLVIGGLIRIRKNNRTWGIIVAHVGIVIMLVAGFVKFRWSIEGNLALSPPGFPVGDMRFPQRSSGNVFQSYTEWELAIHEAVDAGTVTEHLIPASDWQEDVQHAPVTYTSDALPFDLTVTRAFRNGGVVPKGPMFEGDGPVIDGYVVLRHELEKEAEYNVPAAYVTATEKGSGKRTDAIVSGLAEQPLTIVAGGKAWLVEMRRMRFNLPFTVRVDKFTYEVHPGTREASVYLSDITKIEDGREQSLKITMNEPLRHEGYTLYQSSYGPKGIGPGQQAYTVFAVVKNPSDQWPKWSCYIIALGLLWHFGAKLIRFVRSQHQRPVEPLPATPAPNDAARSRTAPTARTHA